MATITKTIEADRTRLTNEYFFAYPDPNDDTKLIPVDHLIATIKQFGGMHETLGILRLDTAIKLWLTVTIPIASKTMELLFKLDEVESYRQIALKAQLDEAKKTLANIEANIHIQESEK